MALSDGLVGNWSPWLGSSGYRLLDRTRYANHGTLTNMDAGTDWVGATILGRSGFSLDITDNQSINCGTMIGAAFNHPFAVSCWIRNATSAGADFGIVTKLDIANQYAGWGLLCSAATNGKLQGFWANAFRVTGATTITQNANWLHVGLYWTGSVAGVIVNGAIDATANTTTAPNATADALHIGRYVFNANRSMRGQVGETAIWNRALSVPEWREIYRLGQGWYRPYSKRGYGYAVAGFRAYWHRRQQQIIGGGLR